jgi:hypothetical protein
VYDFGLTDEQFWALTPPQFSALSERYDQENYRNDSRVAQQLAMMANIHCRKEGDAAYTAQMFMPDYEGEEAEKKEVSAEDMLEYLKAAFPPRPEGHG